MPELKRLFLKGRMNKDLDERLVPNGEYRDALNIQISSSEGSDVGAIENILGNQVAKLKKAFPATNWELESGSTNYYGLPLDAKCVGAIKDDINDKIYWFVASSTVDCIIEYENQYGQVRPVLVDTQNILKFSTNNLITGINILDNYLFFTDNNSEPKKVNVTKGVFSSANFTAHSQYKGRNFVESDITVIKKSPLRAPEVSFADSKRGGSVTTTIVANFVDGGTNSGALGASLPLSEDDNGQTYNFAFQSSVVWYEGDIIKLTANPITGDLIYDGYEVRLQITAVYSPVFYQVIIIGISPEVPDDNSFLWEAELEQEDPIFEFKFPRFGYRWKYEDNQFSSFSPFTEVVFLPSKFDYNGKKGFNEGMANTIRLINLFDPALYLNATDFQNKVTDLIPDDVEKIEILYKETNNPAVYIVDEIDPIDLVYATWEGYKIESELIYKIVQSNQILRPWDNVPRKAKAQEIVGNRLVYGNYLQNYTLNAAVKLNASSRVSSAKSTNIYSTSVKSDRVYQAGVVFKDEYGRETPVFTSKEAYINIPKTSSGRANQIAVQGVNAPPQGFTHYKYFIKDLAGEYYNLAAERIYPSNDGVSTWIAFPSSERNKISEDDYLILKKGHNSTLPVIDNDNKYRILSIKNEAPAEITEKRVLEQNAGIAFGATYGSYTPVTIKTTGGTPVQGETVFLIAQENENGGGLVNGVGEELKESLKAGNYIKFSSSVGDTNYYKILRVQLTGVDEAAKVYLTTAFGNDVDCLYEADGSGDLRLTENELLIYSVDNDSVNAKYQGFFFVKIEANQVLLNNVFTNEGLVGVDSHTFLGFENLDPPNASTQQITDTTFDDPYDTTTNTFLQIWGGGVSPRRTYDKTFYNGGLAGANAGTWDSYNANMPSFADEEGDTEWDIVPEMRLFDNTLNVVPEELPLEFWDALQTEGTKIRFSNHDTVYTIQEVREFTQSWFGLFSNEDFLQRLYIKFDKPLEQTVNPNFLQPDEFISISILGLAEDSDYPSNNPAVFETEPKELADLNIYYEASDAFPIAEYNNVKTLTWHNCFSFGNGVESNRIRDDFNAAFIDKGTKASAVLEDPYEEERRATGLIYSGIYNSTSGLNSLNQFIQAEKITKDLNPIYGSIQKLHTRDTNLVTLCEDKCLRILANKDALFNADGNVNVTSNNNVLGQAVPFAGEFGISKNPESFASYGFRAYFSDKKRGVVLRLSMDGLTEISNKGMSDYFYDNLKAATTVLGSYDIYSDAYTLTLNNDTVCFKESSDGWPTRKSFIPEYGISLNSDYYTFSNGMIWTHDNENRNTFYEGSTAKSSVQLIFNDNPSKIKNFKTISYEGDSGWIAPLIQTDQQDGAVTTFLDKENIYYNYIRGLNDTWDNSGQTGTLDLKQFAAQGIGQPSSIEPYTGNTTFTVTVKNDPLN
jgi:hypothetical protein